jgi:hypothetical protein
MRLRKHESPRVHVITQVPLNDHELVAIVTHPLLV